MAIPQVWINLHRQHVMSFIQGWCERDAKSHVAKEISGRGLRRSRDEKGNQGSELEIFVSKIFNNFILFISFFQFLLVYYFFSILFLPTTFTHTHTNTHDPRPLPTAHDPRHLATLFAGYFFLIIYPLHLKVSDDEDWPYLY